MNNLAIAIPAQPPVIALLTAEDVIDAFTAAGVRVYVFQGQIGFGLQHNHDWDYAYTAFELLSRLPGQHEALKRYLTE